MLGSAWNYARSIGLTAIEGIYLPSAKNLQVADLYQRLGFTLVDQANDGSRTYRAALEVDREAPPFIHVQDSTRMLSAKESME